MLYRDFDDISIDRFVIFLSGCGATFLGVLILTRPNIPEIFSPSRVPSTFSTPSSANHTLPGHGDATDSTPLLNHRLSVQSTPINRNHRSSTASLGLSPAQYLLLAAASPRENTHGVPPRVRVGAEWDSSLAIRSTSSLARRSRIVPLQLPHSQPPPQTHSEDGDTF